MRFTTRELVLATAIAALVVALILSRLALASANARLNELKDASAKLSEVNAQLAKFSEDAKRSFGHMEVRAVGLEKAIERKGYVIEWTGPGQPYLTPGPVNGGRPRPDWLHEPKSN